MEIESPPAKSLGRDDYSKVQLARMLFNAPDPEDYGPPTLEEVESAKWRCVFCHEIKEETDEEHFRPTHFEIHHGPFCQKCWDFCNQTKADFDKHQRFR